MGRADASVGAVVAWALAVATPANAAPSRLEFSWKAPATCPDRQMVLHDLEAVLDEHTVELASAAIRGDIVRSGQHWVLSLDVQVGKARRVRQLSAESCDDLGKAAAVALGLLIRPLIESEADASERAAANASPQRAAPVAWPAAKHVEHAAPDIGPSVNGESAPLAWHIGAEGVVDSSTLAGPALGASVQSQLRLGDWGFGAYGVLLPALRHDVVGGSVEFEQWALGLRGCHALWKSSWRLDGCTGAELGRVTGRGSGLNRTRNEVSDRWLAASAGLHLGWHALPHAALLGGIEAVVPLLRENYVINGDDAVHETPHLTARVSVGIEFDLL